MPMATFEMGRKFVSERVADPKLFHKSTIRTVTVDGHRVRVGVPKAFAKYPYADTRFIAPTRLQSLLHPKQEFRKKYPRRWARLQDKLLIRDMPTSEPISRAVEEAKRFRVRKVV